MIRIWRGKEPTDLAKARRKYLARACVAWAGGASARVDRDDDQRQKQRNVIELHDGYHVARGDLHRAQHQKCAYCERQEGLANQPVEHFRPKGGAVRDVDDARNIDDDHYFWLAWSWENMFFTCTSCNGRGTKGNKFPLLEDVTKLPLPSRTLVLAWPDEHFNRTREKAMLVDPSREDPMNFIRWIPNNPEATWDMLRWEPQGVDPEKRGATTIEILGLRQDLPDHVSAMIRAHVVPKMTRLLAFWDANDPEKATDIWDQVEQLFASGLPYLAATYDAIEWFLEKIGLTELEPFIGRRLEDLRPGAREAEVPSTDIVDPPECASLPVELVLQIRAEDWTARDAVLALCTHCAWDDPTALAALLGYEARTVLGAARVLVREGRIQQTAAGGFGPR